MMKTHWVEKSMRYTGAELRPLFAYMEFGVLGPSCVAFIGPCDVDFSHMLDGEDLRAKSPIRGGKMLHFIFEMFDTSLFTGVLVQRIFAAIVKDEIAALTPNLKLDRKGDDLYWGNKKLSISVAVKSSQSTLVHFAINITNDNTPVETCALNDFKIDATSFGQKLLERIKAELDDSLEATWKVRSP